MIKTLIIEDEKNVSEALKKMLRIIEPAIEVVAETAFVKEGVEQINKLHPDLIFLDIELEDGTGFDVLDQLNEFEAQLIFTTAYNQHAIKAFKYSAVDYLLKPVDPEELKNAVARAKDNLEQKLQQQELLQVLQNNMKQKEKKIVLKTTEQRYVVYTKDIILLKADGAYTIFVTNANKIYMSKNIKYYQEILDNNFIRCHQSYLINKKHVKAIKDNNLIMDNDEIVPISTRKKTEVINAINGE